LSKPAAKPESHLDVLALQPDVILQQPGYFDAQALGNSPALANTFQVDFVWLGFGTPGSQLFSIYDVNFATSPAALLLLACQSSDTDLVKV